MNLCLNGFKNNCHHKLMGDLIIHKNRHLTERETRILVNVSIEKGYESLSDVPDEIADKICNPDTPYEEFKEYDDTPEFIAFPELKKAIHSLSGYANYDFDAERLLDDLCDELGLDYEILKESL